MADVIGTQVEGALDSAASCKAPPATLTHNSASDWILLNTISIPLPCVPLWVEFLLLPNLSEHVALPSIEIVEPKVCLPMHVTARTR
jgi:hypothetical protein